MKYSLIQIIKEHDGLVDGVWIQNHVGDINSAIKKAVATERVNSSMFEVAIIEEISNTCPIGVIVYDRVRLG